MAQCQFVIDVRRQPISIHVTSPDEDTKGMATSYGGRAAFHHVLHIWVTKLRPNLRRRPVTPLIGSRHIQLERLELVTLELRANCDRAGNISQVPAIGRLLSAIRICLL